MELQEKTENNETGEIVNTEISKTIVTPALDTRDDNVIDDNDNMDIGDLFSTETKEQEVEPQQSAADIASNLDFWKSEYMKLKAHSLKLSHEMDVFGEKLDHRDEDLKCERRKNNTLQKKQEALERELEDAKQEIKTLEDEKRQLTTLHNHVRDIMNNTKVPLTALVRPSASATTSAPTNVARLDAPAKKLKLTLPGNSSSLTFPSFPCKCGKTTDYSSMQSLRRHLQENTVCLLLYSDDDIRKLFGRGQYLEQMLKLKKEAQLPKKKKNKNKI